MRHAHIHPSIGKCGRLSRCHTRTIERRRVGRIRQIGVAQNIVRLGQFGRAQPAFPGHGNISLNSNVADIVEFAGLLPGVSLTGFGGDDLIVLDNFQAMAGGSRPGFGGSMS